MARAKRTAEPSPPRLPVADAGRLGAILLALLVLLAIPGIVLALTYATDPTDAHDAVAAKDAGPLRNARGLHAWAATLALALTLLHLARSYVAGRMDVPGRAATFAGLGALAVLLAAFFSGTILPWDQQGWEAFQHLQSALDTLGLSIGGADPGATPLRLLFLAHVLVVPAAILALLALHVRRAGGIGASARRVWALVRSAWGPIAALAALAFALAILAPPALGPAPIAGLGITRPDWPFLWLVPLQDAFGAPALLALPIALLIGAGALFLPSPTSQGRRIVLLSIVAGAWLALTLLGLR